MTTFLDYSSLENTDEQKGIKIKFDFHNQTTLRYIITLKISVYTYECKYITLCCYECACALYHNELMDTEQDH